MNPIVRPDRAPAADYISKDFLQQENEHVWPKVWLMACREEELELPGAYQVFDIVRDSILLVRQQDGGIKAFHNVCMHRGRRLKSGCGQIGKSIYCQFHGWSWNPDGSLKRVVNPADWAGCPEFGSEDLRLSEVRVASWGGWVFVTMNPDAPPLAEYLGDVPEHLDCYELEKTRCIWQLTVTAPVNWKLVLGAFNEAYHVEATHPQTLRFASTKLPSEAHGIHSKFGPTMFDQEELPNRPAAMVALQKDPRDIILESAVEMHRDLQALNLDASVAAARRLHAECPAGTDIATLQAKLYQFNVEAIEAEGAEWPAGLNLGTIRKAGFGWHLFPNFIILLSLDGTLCYRTRPHPEDPGQCVWDIWAFGRFAPGKEPKPVRTVADSYEDALELNRFLRDDLINLPEVQRGMHSRGLPAIRFNPVQEQCQANLHRAIHELIEGATAQPG